MAEGQLYFIQPGAKRRPVSKKKQVGCETCPLNPRLIHRVDSYGDPRSPIWWAGEAPGRQEAENHEPFFGASGKFHWERVKEVIGLEKPSMYTGNCARCWPSDDNRTPTKDELHHCLPFLEAEIRQYHPVVIGALGAVAFQSLTGRREAISDVVGQEFLRPDGVKVIALYHPSYGLRMGMPPEFVKLYDRHVRRVYESSKSRERTDFWKLEGYNVQLLKAYQWKQYVDYIKKKVGWCAVDIETKEGRVPFLISSAYGTKRGVVARWDEVKDQLAAFFSDHKIAKVFQNGGGFDIPEIEKHLKCVVEEYLWDTFVAGVTLDSRKGRNNLSRLTEWAVPELAGYEGEVERYVKEHGCKEDYSKIPPELVIPYAGYDAVSTALIYLKEKPIAYEPLVRFYMDLIREVLTPMERTGLKVDEKFLDEMISYLRGEVERLNAEIRAIAGDPGFNPGSPKQIAELLFTRLKLPLHGIRKSKKTGVPAVDKETFEKLAGKHKVVDLMKGLRKDEKDLGTYGERIKDQLKEDRRFYVRYWVSGATEEEEEHGTETGRLSSTLQNIPRVDKDHPRKYEPANIFVADKGTVLLVPDYSQAELRAQAVIAREKQMISDFKRGFDAHDAVCHRYLGVPEGQKPSKAVRVKAKGVNFAKIFGAGANKLSQQLGISVSEVLELFKADKAAYPDYWRWRKWQIEQAARDGCVYTMFGFRRPLSIPEQWQYIELELEHWMKQALNTPVQGTAAQIMLLAMLIIKRMKLPCTMLMNIHDSAPTQVQPRHLDFVARKMKWAMEVAVVEEVWKRFKKDISVVPWVVEFETGERLGQLKPYLIGS